MTDDALLDVLVIGGGMAGLTTAARAAERGATVGVLEVAENIGGSAALSGGYVYTAPTLELFLDEDPGGDPALFEALLGNYDAAFRWLDDHGIDSGPVQSGIKGFGVGKQVNIHQYLRRMVVIIESHGGWIARRTRAVEPLLDSGHVVGARARTDDGRLDDIFARRTVIATGGFQSSPEWRARYLAPHGEDLILRSNDNSVGDGIAFGLASGAHLSAEMGGYYGHLIPYPLERFEEPDYVRLAQYHSEHGLLLDKSGRRFVDESLGDHVGTQAVGHRRTALMLIDDRILQDHVLATYMSGPAGLNKLAAAGDVGAHYATGDTLADIAAAASEWGYDGTGMVAAVAQFNSYCRGEHEVIDPPRKRFRLPIERGPFAVLEVQSGITFTYGGLVTDVDNAVLGEDGRAVPGLFAVGADAGGLNHRGYTGGLIRGLVLGHRLGEHLVPEHPLAAIPINPK